ncbi:MAG: AI-2E family transporter [Anaerolineae bacterium]
MTNIPPQNDPMQPPETDLPERVLPFISYTPQWSTFIRRIVIVCLLISGIVAAWVLGPVMQTLIVTGLLCFLLYMPSRILAARTPLNFPCSVVIIYLVLVLFLALVIVALLPSIANVIRTIGDAISQFVVQLRNIAETATPETSQVVIPGSSITVDAWPILGPLKEAFTGQATQAVSSAPAVDVGAILSTLTTVTGDLVSGIAGIVSTGFLAILLSFLILIDLPRYQSGIARGIAPMYRREIYLLTTHVNSVWSGFFRGQLVICLLIGILTFLQLTLMGVGNAIGIAVIVALISLIPTIGGVIALIPMFFVPLLGGSSVPMFQNMSNVSLALLVTVIYLIWSQIVWTVVAPKILGDAVSIPLPVIILGIGVGLAIGGILGAFLIVPILGTLRLVVIYIIAKLNGRDPFPGQGQPDVVDLSTL